MFNAYKKYWKNYANFEGRSSRSDFWWVFLINVLIAFIAGIIAVFMVFGTVASIASNGSSMDYYDDTESIRTGFAILSTLGPMWLVSIVWWLANFLPSLAISVRRLRDAGLHWAFIFLLVGPSIGMLIPFINIIAALAALPCQIAFIVLMCRPSKQEPINYQAGYQGAANQASFNQFNQGANPGQGQFGPNQASFNQFNQGANPEQGQFSQNQASFNQFNQSANPEQGQFGQNQLNQFTPPTNPNPGQFAPNQEPASPVAQAAPSNQEAVSPVTQEPAPSQEAVTPSSEEANPFSAVSPLPETSPEAPLTDSENQESQDE